jgi:hypothetical protein
MMHVARRELGRGHVVKVTRIGMDGIVSVRYFRLAHRHATVMGSENRVHEATQLS